MNYLKVVLMLWTYSIAFDTSETAAVVRGSINPWDSKQKYCGELLTRSIEIVCVEMKIKRRPRDTVRQVAARHGRNMLLQKSCCDDECSLNFIKSHCPVKRNRSKKKNHSVGQSPVNSTQKSIIFRTKTTALPLDKLLRPKMKNATVSTSATTTTPTSTTPTSTTSTSTTSTSTTTTTTTTTEEPSLSLEDYEFYLGFSP